MVRFGRSRKSGRRATRKLLQNRFSKALKLAAVAVGSWRFWVGSALAAVTAAVVTAVAYTVFFANSGAGSYPYSTLGGDRILLMNADINETCPVMRQGYTDIRSTTIFTNYWTHSDEDACQLFYYKPKGYDHTYWKDDDTRLWSLKNCRFGNTWVDNKGTFVSTQNYLPFSSTARRVNLSAMAIGSNPHYSGQIVMQNTPDSRVVSSCLEGGIGTIYFDAVNGFTGYKLGELTVEVAYGVFKTNPDGSVVGTRIPDDLELERDEEGQEIPGRYVKPDDAHCDEIIINRWTPEGGVEQATTNAFGRCAWIAVNLSGVSRCNGSTAALAPKSSVKLEMPLSGNAGSYKNFYRVWAPVQDPSANPDLAAVCNLPMRFRIRRLDDPRKVSGNAAMGLDGEGLPDDEPYRNGLILIDNVIASYPAMKAMAVPGGEYVAGGSSRNVIGWTDVMTPDPASPVRHYPKVGEKLFAVAGFEFFTNAPPAAVSADTWLAKTQAKMMYRLRYLAMTNDWEEIGFRLSDGRLVSDGEIGLPGIPGDIEYYYDTVLDAPYYAYVDYSGTTELSDPTPGYRERIDHVESHFDASSLAPGEILPSTGTEFFTRLREGASDQLEYRLEIARDLADGTAATNVYPFYVTADATWKTFVRTTTNKTSLTALPAGPCRFRITGIDPATNYLGEANAKIPVTAKSLTPQPEGDTDWTPIEADAETGALMFQIVENASADPVYTVMHASYQDFTTWSDAASTGLYTGAFEEGRGKKTGSSADTREFPGELGNWSEMAAENAKFWSESFLVDSTETPEQGWGVPIRYPAYVEFPECNTRQGWRAANSQWTCAKWRESAPGGNMALQLRGAGKGSVAFTNAKHLPHGVDAFRLRARVAESAKFSSFEYYMGEGLKSLTNYIFTTRVVMSTTDASTSFDGNGSVSLVGYYQPNKGCYEFRAERTADNTVTFYLYKWAIDPASGEVTPTLLGRHASTRNFTTYTYLRCNNAGGTSSEQGSAYYGEMFIRCRKDGSNTIVEAGMMSGSGSNNTTRKLSESCSGYTHYYFKYTDSTSPFTFGSFGFGSLNCPAQFIKPQLYRNGTSGTFPNVATNSKNERGGDVTNPKCGNGTVTYPTTGTIEDMFKLDSVDQKNTYEGWLFNTNRFTLGKWTANELKGVQAQPVSGALQLEVTDSDGGILTNLTYDVKGFTYDTNVVFRVRNTEDSYVRLLTGAKSADIAVDDLSLGQWRAGSYDDGETKDFDNLRPGFGCPENYVYVNGCVRVTTRSGEKVHTIDLQPRRADPGEPVSIRAPLMDNQNDYRQSEDPEGRHKRGWGLGMISYSYANADSNCVVLVQIKEISGSSNLKNPTAETTGWTTVATNDFRQMTSAQRAGGTISTFVGRHGFTGAMRLVIDPQVVAAARDEAKNPDGDPTWGSITITDFMSRDEPPIDSSSWWGWNLRTTSATNEVSLSDFDGKGLALALNNSVSDSIERTVDGKDITDLYPQHLPFVQTPSFGTNTVGEIAFRARRLPGCLPGQFTEVILLGAADGNADDDDWTVLTNIVVKTDVYERYSYKAPATDSYGAFRLAAVGVDGLADGVPDYKEYMRAAGIASAQRVLIDEIEISEAVYGEVGFYNVGAFRNPLDRHTYIGNLFDIEQQPMCAESWSVQCEVRKTQLPEEVVLDDSTEVYLGWHVGKDKWGWQNWIEDAKKAKHWAKLVRVPDRDDFVYRGSYPLAGDAVIEPNFDSGTVVQFVVEVRYRMADGSEAPPKRLASGEWTKPTWYAGVDYNAGRTGGDFAAYTILDTVAYGYAWINEVNLYDGPDLYDDQVTNQFIEVAVPAEADITGWELRAISGGLGDTAAFFTNTIAFFSDPVTMPDGLPGRKSLNMASNYVFITAGTRTSLGDGKQQKQLKELGWIDGPLTLDGKSHGSQISPDIGTDGFTFDVGMPIGLQLVRPSGIIEHQIVVAGTNRYENGRDPRPRVYSATNFVARLQALDPAKQYGTWYFTGYDRGTDANLSRGVTNFTGVITDESVWGHIAKTPGRINEGEAIPSEHPHPQGSMIVLYAQLGDKDLDQTIATHVRTTENLVLYVPKGLPDGTNITYCVKDWHELAAVSETEVGKGAKPHPEAPGSRGTVSIAVAKDASNDVTVVATSRIRSDLVETYGLEPDNPYTPAVMKWLETGTWGREPQSFAHPGGEICLAEYHDINDQPCAGHEYLRLIEMYWLDMDPTVTGSVFQAGFCDSPVPTHVSRESGGEVFDCEDVVLGVMMKIYNKENAFEPYAPYTLNGIEPGRTSRTDGTGWDSVTFKITACLPNEIKTKDPDEVWKPVRYFYFGNGSFDGYKAKIQVIDPYYQFPDWRPWKGTLSLTPWYSFDLDTRKYGAMSSELLLPDSTFK